MKNETLFKYFYILPFSGGSRNKPLLSTFFFLIYLVGVLINSSIITVICLETKLHKPMYLFICNLSIVDIFYTSVIVPKLLHMLLSENYIVSSTQCYTQLYFFLTISIAEEIVLFTMAYDRYLAICDPLHYHCILNRRNCILITIGIWTVAFLDSIVIATSALYMSSCHSNIIHQFFCDVKSLTMSTCTSTWLFFIVAGLEVMIFVVIPLVCTFISYSKIFSVIFEMKSRESRKKAFSTCSSHVTIICIYYGAGLVSSFIPNYSEVMDLIFNTIYTNIIPLINPIIYSLQNACIRSALLVLVRSVRKIAPKYA